MTNLNVLFSQVARCKVQNHHIEIADEAAACYSLQILPHLTSGRQTAPPDPKEWEESKIIGR